MAPSNKPTLLNENGLHSSKRTAEKEYQRVYKACIPCRKRKAKCDLTSLTGGEDGPPCARCRREHRECVFTAERGGGRRTTQDPRPVASTSGAAWPEYSDTQSDEHMDKRQKLDTHDQEPSREIRNSTGSRTTGYITTTSYGSGRSSNTLSASPALVLPPKSSRGSRLDDSVMRTVVSRGNDALDILFEAAAHQERTDDDNAQSASLLKLWNACRFVTQGWITAQEAITYVDLFFKHMSPLSPIINDFYAQHGNHRQLLTDEPLLCCTILSISSRYHILPGVGGALRSTLVHDRLWRYCQDLLTRTIFGQEKGTNPKTRGIGTIEALLLISEWHPRSLHFPPDNNGWDSGLLTNQTYSQTFGQQGVPKVSSADRWLEDVVEPARRSDRMSWMLMGNAMTLAHELGIFEDESDSGNEDDLTIRRMRIRKLLYVYVNHLAYRLGYLSLIPQSFNQVVSRQLVPKDVAASQWQSHMTSWIELTKFSKSVSDTFFPSAAHTKQLLHSGRYTKLLEQFLPLLDHWRRVHLESQSYQGSYQETLFIEYHYVRIYINSLGMQAACERALANADLHIDQNQIPQNFVLESEYGFIQEVIDGSCEILRKVIRLAETDTLRFAPVRIYLRITTSSIFLLKALSLGVRNDRLQPALDILEQSIQALKASNLDEVHLAARYATLLDTHVQKVREGFIANAQRQLPPFNDDLPLTPVDMGSVQGIDYLPLAELPADSWTSLPFDPSMAPFAPDADFAGLNDNALDFIWNLNPIE